MLGQLFSSKPRAAQLLGTKVSVLVEIKKGRGKVQIRDTIWQVTCEQDLPCGRLVEVTGSDGSGKKDTVLHVQPVR